MFLGGPLYYCQGLRYAFKDALKLDDDHAIFPEYGRLSVAIGAALYAASLPDAVSFETLLKGVEASTREKTAASGKNTAAASGFPFFRYSARKAQAAAAQANVRITALQ